MIRINGAPLDVGCCFIFAHCVDGNGLGWICGMSLTKTSIDVCT